MSGNLLSIPDIIGSDPLGHLLRRLRLSPLRFAMIFFLAGVVYVGGLAAASGYLLPRPGSSPVSPTFSISSTSSSSFRLWLSIISGNRQPSRGSMMPSVTLLRKKWRPRCGLRLGEPMLTRAGGRPGYFSRYSA